MTFKAIQGAAPQHICELMKPKSTPRTLRPSDANLLAIKSIRTKTFGDRALSTVAPKLWHKLPYDLRGFKDLAAFKRSLKTFLFKTSYICNIESG